MAVARVAERHRDPPEQPSITTSVGGLPLETPDVELGRTVAITRKLRPFGCTVVYAQRDPWEV